MTPIIDRLPEDPRERQGILDAYFQRRLAESTRRRDDRWSVELRPFDDIAMHVDPSLRAGLDWWLPELAVEDIPMSFRRSDASQLSLEDSWTAFSWSTWLSETRATRATILHVDDHDDLMAPLLRQDSEVGWVDLITGQRVDLTRPDTVAEAIASSAIGLAGFFTPFLHAIPTGEVRHLCATDHSRSRPGQIALQPTTVADELLQPGSRRPSVRLAEATEGSGWTYLASTDPAHWLSGLPPGPLLLHVDFDYFCNRFDGDSDWQSCPARNATTRAEIFRRVDALVDALVRADVAHRIDDVCGALSPGFFPAEYWADTVGRLKAGLRGAGIVVDGWTPPSQT